MGLDQYLLKKTYVKRWSHQEPDELYTVDVKRGDSRTSIKSERISEVVEEVMYWRKANHIHHWFVQNVQDGVDNCGEYPVSSENLQRLVQDCKDVLENPAAADSILPTQSGFFFGSTDYDEYYIEDTRKTVEVLEALISEMVEASENSEWSDIYYTSSW